MPTTLITGANRGIGLELARQRAAAGWTVLAACRHASPALAEAGVEVLTGVDVASDDGQAALATGVGDRSLDELLCNAGVLRADSLARVDDDAVRQQFEVNALGPLRTVRTLLDRLGRGAKIGLVTSRMGSMADNTSGGYYGYRMSKAALNAAGVSLAHDVKARGVAVAILHPGYVETDMTGHMGHISAEESARGLLERMDELSLETTGTFWHMSGEVLPW